MNGTAIASADAVVDERGVEWRPAPVAALRRDYMLSELGEVWSRPRPHVRGGIIRASGKPYYFIHAGSPRGRYRVHVLVATAFHGPRPPGTEVRHLNGNPHDNAASNLRWGSPTENQLDKVLHGTHNNATKIACPRGHRLEGANLVKSSLPRRDCRSCGNAVLRALLARERLPPPEARRMTDTWEDLAADLDDAGQLDFAERVRQLAAQ